MGLSLFAVGSSHKSDIIEWLSRPVERLHTFDEAADQYLYRVSILYNGKNDLYQKSQKILEHIESGQDEENYIDVRSGLFYIKAKNAHNSVAFVFSGQGSQYCGMLGQYLSNSAYKKAFESLIAKASKEIENLKDIYHGDENSQEMIHETRFAQPLLASVEWGLVCWLKSLGVRSDFSVGHSFGELVALANAEAYDVDSLMSFSLKRAELMNQAAVKAEGKMLAVVSRQSTSWKDLDQKVQGLGQNIEIANINSNQQIVYSGSSEEINALREKCEKIGLKTSLLKTNAAFHSSFMKGLDKNFLEVLKAYKTKTKAPQHRVFSNFKSLEYRKASDVEDYLSAQIVSEVSWVQVVEKLYANGARVFIEVGPKNTQTKLLKQILPAKDCSFITLDAQESLLNISVYLWSLGVAPNVVHEIKPKNEIDAFNVENKVISSFLENQKHLMERALEIEDQTLKEKLKDQILKNSDEVLLSYFKTEASSIIKQNTGEHNSREISPEGPTTKRTSSPLLTLLKGELAELTGFSQEEIKDDANLDNDLALDSITKMDFFASVVEKFEGDPPDSSDLVSLSTLGEVVELLESRQTQEDEAKEKSRDTRHPKKSEKSPEVARRKHRDFREALSQKITFFTGIPSDDVSSYSHFEKDLGLNIFEREELMNSMLIEYPYMQVSGRAVLNVETVGELIGLERGLDRRRRVRTSESVSRFEWSMRQLRRNPLSLGKFDSPVLFVPFFVVQEVDGIEKYLASHGNVNRFEVRSKKSLDEIQLKAKEAAREGKLDIFFLMGPFLDLDDYGESLLEHHTSMIYELCRKLLEVRRDVPKICLKILMNSYGDIFLKGLVGLFRSLSREDKIKVTIVDTKWESIAPKELPWDVLWTSKNIDQKCEYVYGQEGKYYHEVLNTKEADSRPPKEEIFYLEKGDPVLVLGGARGICAEISKYLAVEYEAHIVALGTTPLNHDEKCPKQQEIIKTRDAIIERGGRFTYMCVDACEFEGLSQALKTFEKENASIKGVIHGAGVTDDGLLKDKTYERFINVARTKILSGVNLYKLFKDSKDLKFACFFSSLSSWTGAPGQTDYSFANEVLNELATEWKQKRPHLPVSSLLWSVWGETGLASDKLLKQMRSLHLGTISNADGVRLFRNELERYALRATKVLFTPESTLKYSERVGQDQDE